MLSEDVRVLQRGFEALNKNLTDCAKSLRVIAGGLEQENSWHPAIGDSAVFPDRKIYDWVLVKIKDLKRDTANVYPCPHIAMYHSFKWWPNEWVGCYGTDEVPFEVVAWKPIPGDNCTVLTNGLGEVIKRIHSYE